MSVKRVRVIGTTIDAIAAAEKALGRDFPPSFRSWLLKNNGLSLDGVEIFPVLDTRDPRKTWDSIVRNNTEGWQSWLKHFDDPARFSHLLPFGEFGTGDYYCFDYRRVRGDGEAPVVHWSHETGETSQRAESFDAFEKGVQNGDYDFD